MTEKKVPGSGWVYMVYDDRDRLVLTQDANQRNRKEWLFTKYDQLNRPVLTGIYNNSAIGQSAIQGIVDEFYENNPSNYYESRGTTIHGYTNISFPQVSVGSKYLMVTYYDDYSFQGYAKYPFQNNELNSSYNDRVKGQITASKTRSINNANQWYYTVNYYDDKYRVIQTHMDNHLGETDIINTEYDFIGQVLKTNMIHNNGTNTITINESYNYDHAGRLLSTIHQVNDETPVELASNNYNSLGELIEKNLHKRQGESTYLQSVDFRYNIRGWLTSINDATLGNKDNNPDDSNDLSDLFGMNLGYNESIGTGVDPTLLQFNGNISAMKWNSVTKGSEMSYDYTYDAMNRIKKADSDIDGIAKAYNLDAITYDLNGNILSLNRMDGKGVGMDLLTYTYAKGNQLSKVSDSGTEEGFKDGTNTSNDYVYDANGNMTVDRNKGITKITYNHLNLPVQIWFDATGTKKIVYTYDAAGIKLQKRVFENNVVIKTTDYIGGMIYENGKLQQLAHAEGRIVSDTLPDESVQFKYQYHHKDHLGNVRTTYGETNQTDVYLATMETESGVAEREESQFGNLGAREVSNLGNTTSQQTYLDHGLEPLPVDQIGEALKLNYQNPIGSTIAITVDPGDVVNISAQGFHENLPNGDNGLNPATLIDLLIAAYNPAATGIGESSSQITEAFNSAGATAFIGQGNSTGPGAYLNYLYFDTDFKFVSGGFIGLDANQKNMAFAPLEFNQTGYLYVYTSYESSNTSWRVYFDDVRIEVNKKIEIIQSEDYYPFGLTFNEYNRKSFRENKFLYNGKELQDDFDLNWMDYGARTYYPEIGRWNQLDPLAELRENNNPYNYVQNNPLNRIDPTGNIDDWVKDSRGNVVWDANVTSKNDVDLGGREYLGKTGTGINEENGNLITYNSDGTTSESSSSYGEFTMESTKTDFDFVIENNIMVKWDDIGNNNNDPYRSIEKYQLDIDGTKEYFESLVNLHGEFNEIYSNAALLFGTGVYLSDEILKYKGKKTMPGSLFIVGFLASLESMKHGYLKDEYNKLHIEYLNSLISGKSNSGLWVITDFKTKVSGGAATHSMTHKIYIPNGPLVHTITKF
ncbi:RHS repeat-associated core domain-containing protein [Flammeovirgaceae bacterium KN852]|uniref:RHS repeat-associated core domain-containing protein n=2 Tax=Marinigracilibium pacificum TaxID=2729599 RepID=A0A848J1W3_9BACT|nr:RHS repeat-associated core domain-containing protein [Marinigracilibium pacificum]